MASETSEGTRMTVSLPSELDEWLTQHATELETDRETVLVHLLSAYQIATDLSTGAAVEDLSARLEQADETLITEIEQVLDSRTDSDETVAELGGIDERIDERVSPVQAEVERLREDLAEQFEEVRQRLVQVKRETDEKAPADHTHDELEDVSDLGTRVAAVEDTLEDLQSTVDDRLAAVESETVELDDRMDTVARAVVGLRSRVSPTKVSHQKALTSIRQRAAAEGIETARCANCENRVNVALLAEPVCPHCGVDYAGIEPSERLFFGVATLETDRPQLEEGSE